MKRLVLSLVVLGLTSSLYAGSCEQAVSAAGGDQGFVYGYCNNTSQSESYWRCIVRAMQASGKRGYSNNDVSSVIGFASGYGSCN